MVACLLERGAPVDPLTSAGIREKVINREVSAQDTKCPIYIAPNFMYAENMRIAA